MYRLLIVLIIFGFSIQGKTQDCKRPFAVSFPAVSTDTVKAKWLDTNGSDILGFQLAYGVNGVNINDAIKTDTTTIKEYILKGLNPSTKYDIFIRTICDSLSASDWNGPFTFTTHLTNPTICGTSIALQDENCSLGGETYIIEVLEIGTLGTSVFLESIDLIIEHPWLADLEIIVENPNGATATLTQFNGAAQNNFGIPDESCLGYTRFSSNACLSITEGNEPFVGVYSPISSLLALNDGSEAKGNWKVHICDRSSGDKGLFKFISLNLTPQLCEPIVDFYVSDINGEDVFVNWTPPFNCESIEIEYGPEGFTPNTGQGILKQLNCKKGEALISGLNPLSKYDFYLLGDCITSSAAPSCQSSFITGCEATSVFTSFDNQSLCQNSCAIDCEVLGEWQNSSEDDMDWLVWDKPTESINTGPLFDVNRRGNYIYLDASPDVCGTTQRAILKSDCLDIGANPGCGVIFYYHMEGNDQGELVLEISNNFGISWDTIFSAKQSIGWQRAIVSLDDYIDQFATLRFTGTTALGTEGDIALDQIEFHGTTTFGRKTYYLDKDGDGFGISDSSIMVCGNLPAGFASEFGDCDDNNEFINPAITEIGCNGVDENCNGLDDDNLDPPTIEVTAIVNESCAGLSDGALGIDISGINGPYTVDWNNGNSGQQISNLKAGFYKATITDNTSCLVVTNFYEVKAESKLDIEILAINNATCSGRRDGIIRIKANNGVEQYTYEWNNGQIQATAIGLIEGDYIVTVTDAEGCTIVSDPIHVGVTKPLNVGTIIHQDVTCKNADNGRIRVSTTNGVMPYSYIWAHGPIGDEIDGLSPGSYLVSVEDNIGCESTFEINITEPDSLEQIVLSIEPIKCHGETNGSIKSNTHGGTPPFTYQWNSGQVTDDIGGLGTGEYTLAVTDINGCVASLDTINMLQPDPLILMIDSLSGTTCRLSEDGAIILSLNGGVEPYNYFWRRVEADSLKALNLFAGNYGFTAIDRNDCKVSLPGIDIPFGNVSAQNQTLIKQAYECPNIKNGAIKIEIENGITPITYNWSNGLINTSSTLSDSISNLGSGTYKVTMTDAEGCVSTSESVVFDFIPNFSHSIVTFKTNNCREDTQGIISVDVDGGTGLLNLLWSNDKSGNAIGFLQNGFYNLTVTDENECEYFISDIEMYSESNLLADINSQHVTPGLFDGQININVTDGVPPFTISWDPDSLSGFNLINLDVGLYNAVITDGNECIIDTSIILKLISGVNDINSIVKYYPNPTQDYIYIEGCQKPFKYSIYTQVGHLIRSDNTVDNRLDLTLLNTGLYFIKIDGNNTDWISVQKIE